MLSEAATSRVRRREEDPRVTKTHAPMCILKSHFKTFLAGSEAGIKRGAVVDNESCLRWLNGNKVL